MKFLWNSNAPWVGSGYGSQTGLILKAMKERGHDPSCLAFWGLQGGPVQFDGYQVVPPSPFEAYGNDVIQAHIKNLKPELIVTLMDLFVLDRDIWGSLPVPWAAWIPIDCQDMGFPLTQILEIIDYPVAMSQFGAAEMQKVGIEPAAMIYHAVDTEVFKPTDKRECRAELGIDKDQYIIGMVMANKGDRKQYPIQLQAVAEWAATKDEEVRVLMHTEKTDKMQGWEMKSLVKKCGLKGKVFSSDSYFASVMPIAPEMVAKYYNAMDVLLNVSAGEGFGIPIIEAQACGTPVITGGYTAMPEITINGYCVEPATHMLSGHYGYQFIPNGADIIAKLEAVYRMTDKSKIAEGIDWVRQNCSLPVIAAQWDELLVAIQQREAQRAESPVVLSHIAAHEPWLLGVVPEHGRRALDIGANKGEWTEDLLPRFDKVEAIEPHPTAAHELKMKFVDQPKVDVREMAITDFTGTMILDLYEDPAHTSTYETGLAFAADRSDPTGETIEATCFRLDDIKFDEYVDFVKVDVEGAEVDVLNGANEFIAQHKPGWLIECHSKDNRLACTEILSKYYSNIVFIPHPHTPENGHGWLSVVRTD